MFPITRKMIALLGLIGSIIYLISAIATFYLELKDDRQGQLPLLPFV